MNDQHQHADLLVRIHIDREPYDSPDHTTGAALYTLGGVDHHHDLFREVAGDAEDELIERNDHPVRLTQDEHLYSQKVFTIIVNAETKEVVKNQLSFEDAVKLAFETPPSGPNILITVDYGMGPPANPQGSLLKGQSVRIKNGMVFDVTATDRS
jgi:hypothetical protein